MKILNRTSKFIKNLSILGNVGVGTTTPTAVLDVDGDVKIAVVPDDTNGTHNEIVVVDANGKIFKRTLESLFADDISLSSSNYNSNTNELTLVMSDGTNHTLDLSDLVNITVSQVQDTDGDTKLWIEEIADGDFVHVESAGTSVAKFAKENVQFEKVVSFEKGFAVAVRETTTSDSITGSDHTVVVNPISSNVTLSLPSISSLPTGKVFEFKVKNLSFNTSLSFAAGDTLKGNGSYNLNHKYVRLQADTVNNEWVLLEELRAGGFLVEEIAPSSGTTRTFTELVGYDTTNFDFLRDGLVESSISEFTFDSTTGTITVNEAFESELLQLRLN